MVDDVASDVVAEVATVMWHVMWLLMWLLMWHNQIALIFKLEYQSYLIT